ncbi:HigA family addiction module antidote protein (plasmid) [Rhodovastum atsumiense]|uniref:HigA family addiction module antidote protein n=1 Tax=Rhodovastum atsumiense TaxID=504468 RepID=A0A5M6IN55_9PROT|nr:HigA family addiction module antitoxin [Rhodovastum atsumiense]KAA5609684.1 HigA family addiction module antidote protein [Rhodovastum atsumiense]CAH2606455.1 HigA family addiction module antidote protein [Rhodovastum atsumiense]
MTKPRIRTHPGEVLLEEFMRPLALSANALARDLAVPPNRITAIINPVAPRSITPDTALRLSRYFGTTPEFWMNLQAAHDLSKAQAESAERIAAEVQPRAA